MKTPPSEEQGLLCAVISRKQSASERGQNTAEGTPQPQTFSLLQGFNCGFLNTSREQQVNGGGSSRMLCLPHPAWGHAPVDLGCDDAHVSSQHIVPLLIPTVS